MKLGKIKRITDLRSIWPNEANDFTKWLADEHNLATLGEEFGIELELEERESSYCVGVSQTFIQSVLQIHPYDMVFFHSLFYEVVLEKSEQQV